MTARRRPEPRPVLITPAEAAELKRAAAEYVDDLLEVLTGIGRHADHDRQQAGRCVVCSCGMRVQGRLETRKPVS